MICYNTTLRNLCSHQGNLAHHNTFHPTERNVHMQDATSYRPSCIKASVETNLVSGSLIGTHLMNVPDKTWEVSALLLLWMANCNKQTANNWMQSCSFGDLLKVVYIAFGVPKNDVTLLPLRLVIVYNPNSCRFQSCLISKVQKRMGFGFDGFIGHDHILTQLLRAEQSTSICQICMFVWIDQ